MRTTLDIDDDVLQAAKERARSENKTAGQMLSELARRALTSPPAVPQDSLNGWPQLPVRPGLVVTADDIRRLQDDMDQVDQDEAG
jgi:hypothetical protein